MSNPSAVSSPHLPSRLSRPPPHPPCLPITTSEPKLPTGHSSDEDDILLWCSAALYAGASDTTAGMLTVFVPLMTLHPEVHRQARAEVDHVCERRLAT